MKLAFLQQNEALGPGLPAHAQEEGGGGCSDFRAFNARRFIVAVSFFVFGGFGVLEIKVIVTRFDGLSFLIRFIRLAPMNKCTTQTGPNATTQR
ncbi:MULTISPECIES: hypothetical protein [Bradyrhizobium]|uniref:hypothetical protein n=1 Tax=Bradyrhizobium centrosematis TaxID=1300039 RepID=UPI002167129C|nr:hypothetical protein [Bradyrhizobium centrosematis]MCS3765855.1 hypothetical protein [Bradyrhizobium centrosematis]MCS3778264.1 hypothetical protein [Bradyrhizobium centrosematis]